MKQKNTNNRGKTAYRYVLYIFNIIKASTQSGKSSL